MQLSYLLGIHGKHSSTNLANNLADNISHQSYSHSQASKDEKLSFVHHILLNTSPAQLRCALNKWKKIEKMSSQNKREQQSNVISPLNQNFDNISKYRWIHDTYTITSTLCTLNYHIACKPTPKSPILTISRHNSHASSHWIPRRKEHIRNPSTINLKTKGHRYWRSSRFRRACNTLEIVLLKCFCTICKFLVSSSVTSMLKATPVIKTSRHSAQ